MVTQERVPGTVAGGWWRGRGSFLGMPLLAVVLLVGCSGGSGDPGGSSTSVSSSVSSARSSPSSASSTTTSSSSSSAAYVPVKPKFPAVAKKHTPEGAEAFVRYYLESVNYAWAKPDLTALPPLGESDCESCVNLQETAKSIHTARAWLTGPPLTVKQVNHLVTVAGESLVTSVMQQEPVSRFRPDGSLLSTSTGEELRRTFSLVWASGWHVQDIGGAK